jgi:arginase family enzyme
MSIYRPAFRPPDAKRSTTATSRFPTIFPIIPIPHTVGMTLSEAGQLLGVLMKDPRIRIIEISEYASLPDFDHAFVTKLVDILCEVLEH